MFARRRISLTEAFFEIHAEDTRLRVADLLWGSLYARAPSLLPTPPGGEGCSHTHCGYYNKDGHPESDCLMKKRHMRNKGRTSSSGTCASTPAPSSVSLTKQDIVQLKRMLATLGSRHFRCLPL